MYSISSTPQYNTLHIKCMAYHVFLFEGISRSLWWYLGADHTIYHRFTFNARVHYLHKICGHPHCVVVWRFPSRHLKYFTYLSLVPHIWVSEPMLVNCELDSQEHISVNFDIYGNMAAVLGWTPSISWIYRDCLCQTKYLASWERIWTSTIPQTLHVSDIYQNKFSQPLKIRRISSVNPEFVIFDWPPLP